MKRDFIQGSCSIKHFTRGFMNHWEFSPYKDRHAPTVFMGLHPPNMRKVVKHKGPMILIPGGRGDMDHPKTINMFKTLDTSNCVFHSMDWMIGLAQDLNIPYVGESDLPGGVGFLTIKKYDSFKAEVKGNLIYIYLGMPRQRKLQTHPSMKYKYDHTYLPLVEHFGKKRVACVMERQIPWPKLRQLYNKSFVNIKPTDGGGATTMFEFGHMGKKTISCGWRFYPSSLDAKSPGINFGIHKQFQTINLRDPKQKETVFSFIENEAKLIGTKDEELAERCRKAHWAGNSWLTLKSFNRWKKIASRNNKTKNKVL